MIIKAIYGNLLENIESEKLNGILNSANGIGPMGRGIAGAIRKAGGKEIMDDAFKVCKVVDPQAGETYSTISGKLNVKRIIHAVTMKKPGGYTSYDIVKNSFKAALDLAKEEGITMLGCTALATGVGGLDPIKVADIMFSIADRNEVNVVFMDHNEKFIDHMLSRMMEV